MIFQGHKFQHHSKFFHVVKVSTLGLFVLGFQIIPTLLSSGCFSGRGENFSSSASSSWSVLVNPFLELFAGE